MAGQRNTTSAPGSTMGRRRLWSLLCLVGGLGATVLLTSGPAAAQNEDLRTDQTIDSTQILADRAQTAALWAQVGDGAAPKAAYSPPPLPPGQSLLYGAIDFATTYNTNPPAAAAGAKDSAEFNTKIQLNYLRQFEGVKLSWNGTVEVDRYSSLSSANQDNVVSTLKLEFNGVRTTATDPTPAKDVVGYVFYTPTIRQKNDFEDHKGTLHDLGFGVVLKKPFAGLDKPWGAQLDTNLTRRLSDQSGDSISAILRSRLSYTFNDDLFAVLQPSLRYRVFDETLGFRRKDTTLIVPLLLSWDPHLLPGQRSQIAFGIAATRNWSNNATKRSKQWNIGPTIQLVKPFS